MIVMKFATAINGECGIDQHTQWINLTSVKMGVGRAVSSVGGGKDRESSNPSLSEVTVTKDMDVASTKLWMQALGGKALGKCEIHWLQQQDNKSKVYLTLELEEALISSYGMGSNGERPTESISLNFTKVSYKYDKWDGDSVTAGDEEKWDLEKNAEWT